jgi:hypothetical protein
MGFASCHETGKPVILRREDGSLSQQLFENITTEDFGEECRAAVISPLKYTESSQIVGYIAIGINPRAALDDRCLDFVEATATLMGTSLGSLR